MYPLFFYKYQANSLNTFKNSKSFDAEVAEHIFSSLPLYFQQISIPNEEFIRFEQKFENNELQNCNEPDAMYWKNL